MQLTGSGDWEYVKEIFPPNKMKMTELNIAAQVKDSVSSPVAWEINMSVLE